MTQIVFEFLFLDNYVNIGPVPVMQRCAKMYFMIESFVFVIGKKLGMKQGFEVNRVKKDTN